MEQGARSKGQAVLLGFHQVGGQIDCSFVRS